MHVLILSLAVIIKQSLYLEIFKQQLIIYNITLNKHTRYYTKTQENNEKILIDYENNKNKTNPNKKKNTTNKIKTITMQKLTNKQIKYFIVYYKYKYIQVVVSLFCPFLNQSIITHTKTKTVSLLGSLKCYIFNQIVL